ncbi:MAG: hypothetical protein V3U78_06310 [Thiotrichaceae bacterium]
MKAITTLSNQAFNNELTRTFRHLSRRMLKLYNQHGETPLCVEMIEQEALNFCHAKLNTQKLMQNISPLDEHVREDNSHYVLRIIHKESLKVALHIAPSGTKLPQHAHPGALNLLLVKKGTLQLEQSSQENFNTLKKQTLLTKNQCSAGLQRYFNHHSLQTKQPITLFFVLRCKVPKPLKLMLACSLGLLLPPLYGCGFADFINKEDLTSFTTTTQTPQRETAEMVKLANTIRTESRTDEDHFKAIELYLKAANKNNAEAQYWLSVMYLKGMGITEDDDQALHWVSAASDQNYAPAKELLHHLLTYDEALDC